MLNEKEREKIALKKFSLVAPVINGQTDNQKEYFKKLAAEPIDMPHYGLKRYAVKTFQWWLYLYNRHGLEGLKPGYRSDRGKSRKVTEEIALKIQEKRLQIPNSVTFYCMRNWSKTVYSLRTSSHLLLFTAFWLKIATLPAAKMRPRKKKKSNGFPMKR